MHYRILSLFSALLLTCAVSFSQIDRLDAAAFQGRISEKDVQLVDVRTPEEFAKGHIAGATQNDWLEDGFLDRAKGLNTSKPVLLYCAAGGRSEEAMNALKEAGFLHVADLREGFNGWKRANLPIAVK